MTPQAIIRQAAAEGVKLSLSSTGNIKAAGNGAAVSRWLPILRQHKPDIVAVLAANDSEPYLEAAEERAAVIAEGCGISQSEALERTRTIVAPMPLSGAEHSALDRLARAWGFDDPDTAVVAQQCTQGGELVDGSWLSPEDARAFYLSEAGAIH